MSTAFSRLLIILKSIISIALFFTYAATLMPNATEDPPVEHWKYNLDDRRKFLHEKISKAFAEETGLGNETPTNWSLDRFLDSCLANTPADYKSPDDWTINNLIENNEHALFHPYVLEDTFKKYDVEEDEQTERQRIEPEKAKADKEWTFKDFTEKYKPMTFWEQVNEEELIVGRNDSHDKRFFSLIKSLDSTDELLSLDVPPLPSRRWWNDQWQLPIGPNDKKLVNTDDIQNSLLFMQQTIYQARDKMILMEQYRQEFKTTALYKMGFLFAKTDYACKIFSSLSFKTFRACSMVRQGIFGFYRLFHNYMDIVYNIERLLARWFDVDILKDLLTSNDVIARKIILKDLNLTTPAMVVKAFNEMFVD